MGREEADQQLLQKLKGQVKEFTELLEKYVAITERTPDEVREKMPIYGIQQFIGAFERMLPTLRNFSGKFENWQLAAQAGKAKEATKPRKPTKSA